jgi:hypothetical protein
VQNVVVVSCLVLLGAILALSVKYSDCNSSLLEISKTLIPWVVSFLAFKSFFAEKGVESLISSLSRKIDKLELMKLGKNAIQFKKRCTRKVEGKRRRDDR